MGESVNMAFERKELNENLINGGEKYENGDSLQPTAVNEIVGAVLNLQEKDSGGKLYQHNLVVRSYVVEAGTDVDIVYSFYSTNPTPITDEDWRNGNYRPNRGQVASFCEMTGAFQGVGAFDGYAGTVFEFTGTTFTGDTVYTDIAEYRHFDCTDTVEEV